MWDIDRATWAKLPSYWQGYLLYMQRTNSELQQCSNPYEIHTEEHDDFQRGFIDAMLEEGENN